VNVRDAAEGKLDLLTVLDFRMSTTCLYGDIVLPSATFYEKNDLNTSDMHPFIHPLSEAVQPLWESRSDWDIYKAIARKFTEIGGRHLGTRTDLVCTPLMHDTPGELGQAFEPKDWRHGECDLIPGKTAPSMTLVERDYNAIYDKFTSVGPLLAKLGNGGKGITWNTAHEVRELASLSGENEGRPRLDTAIDAAEMILTFAPETNGHVAVKAWEALSKITGRDHVHLALGREHDKIRFRDVQTQPRKIISAPTWSGLESEEVSYNAGYTNVHELIPWRTLTGRQQFYQDHRWMLDFGEGSCVYKPAIDTKTISPMLGAKPNGERELVLNWITPHQKWGIHSTYTDNLRMLTLSRGGPHVWVSEAEAKEAGLKDNDWVEVFNVNGTLTARVVVSQRVPRGMCLMYHAQEKIINVPGAETSGMRGGIHNSVTRTASTTTALWAATATNTSSCAGCGRRDQRRGQLAHARERLGDCPDAAPGAFAAGVAISDRTDELDARSPAQGRSCAPALSSRRYRRAPPVRLRRGCVAQAARTRRAQRYGRRTASGNALSA